ncbi:hypothetical protein PGTUg99_021670 [Puccinia graminis f. sp. tritici]|uniref:Uncharacterized protein n=1 Tax=Puccinia graminis f. sp. tritici TaxID=56615 RepID=A0A5B0RV62_PUCGR|nr:hypothetical protein PGTUg99_021670 [Puccinia graminis f. sp. tritici]
MGHPAPSGPPDKPGTSFDPYPKPLYRKSSAKSSTTFNLSFSPVHEWNQRTTNKLGLIKTPGVPRASSTTFITCNVLFLDELYIRVGTICASKTSDCGANKGANPTQDDVDKVIGTRMMRISG